jgi:large subunit ribosomal protein L15e
MGMYKYVRAAWNKPTDSMSELYKARLVQWRKEPVTIRIEHPTRIDRARSLGYRAKQGVFVVRQRVNRGGHRKPFPMAGRRSRKWTTRKSLVMNYQTIAEQRAAKQFINCEVLNSYEVGKDGRHYWYEIIMVDVSHPAVKADPEFSKLVNQRGRVFRGLTSSAKRGRGLLHKGMGAEKLRPSKKANRARRFY